MHLEERVSLDEASMRYSVSRFFKGWGAGLLIRHFHRSPFKHYCWWLIFKHYSYTQKREEPLPKAALKYDYKCTSPPPPPVYSIPIFAFITEFLEKLPTLAIFLLTFSTLPLVLQFGLFFFFKLFQSLCVPLSVLRTGGSPHCYGD